MAYPPVGLGVGHAEERGRSAWKDCDEFAASPAGPPLGLVLDTHELGRRAGAMKVVRTIRRGA